MGVEVDDSEFGHGKCSYRVSPEDVRFSADDQVLFPKLPSYSEVAGHAVLNPTSDTRRCGMHTQWVVVAAVVVVMCLLVSIVGSVCMVHLHGSDANTQTGHLAFHTTQRCSQQPCRNGETCYNGEEDFICKCRAGFSGLLCETEKDECLSSPCHSEATCEDVIDGYICHCQPGYTGQWCNQDLDECLISVCRHGAKCYNDVGGYRCWCPPGYTGTHCETDLDECMSSPCDNAGTCEDLENGYRCHCPKDYIGATCRTGVLDQCSPGFQLIPDAGHCYHVHETSKVTWSEAEAACVQMDASLVSFETKEEMAVLGARIEYKNTFYSVGGQRTRMYGPFKWKTGAYIENTDPIWWEGEPKISKECLTFWNTAYSSISSLVTIACHELARYVCEKDVLNVCLSDPCMNGATCLDGVGHRCLCLPGFTGSRCETDIDECSSSPCYNGALCQDHINSYSCVCTGNSTGDRCQNDPTVQCPTDYLLYRELSRCYLIVEDPQLAWGDAHEMCEHRGASLASLETVSELQYVGAQLQMEGRYHLVSGRRERDGEFYWSTQSVLHVAHSAWAANEPRARKDCTAVIARDGLARLYSVRCDDARPYVCERGTL